jgi:hypothetical protein
MTMTIILEISKRELSMLAITVNTFIQMLGEEGSFDRSSL